MTQEEFILALEDLGLKATSNQLLQLEKFYQFLIETNKTMNLTRIVEKKDVYLKHFYDSLTLVKAYSFEGNLSLCDVGSGAGFPGIVLKIFFPNLKVTLIDALQKRINYLNNVIQVLGLVGIEALHVRAEDLAIKNKTFDIVTAMKGNVNQELELTVNLLQKNHWILEKKISFLLPKEASNRTILIYRH